MRKFIVLPLLVLLAACTDRGPIGPDDEAGTEFLAKKGGNPGKGGGGKPQPPANPEIAYRAGSDRLFVINADGTRQTEVYQASYLANPSWSPRGRGTLEDPYSIVFRKDSKTYRDPDNSISLWVIDLVISDGEPVAVNPMRITEPNQCGNPRATATCQPAWSPNGEWIAVTERHHLWKISAEGCLTWAKCATELYGSDDGNVHSLAWSPESDRIAVFVNPPGLADAFIAIVDATALALVLHTINLADLNPPLDYVFAIDWARTRDVLALDALSVGGSGRRVWTLDLTACLAAEPSCTVELVVEGVDPTWSPTDGKLAFAGRGGIKVLDIPTGNVERLAKGGQPDWRR